MCSLQSASVANFGKYPSEQLEDDFITNLFSQNISSNNHDSLQTTPIPTKNSYQYEVQSDSKWFLENQMDHDYDFRAVPSTLPLSTWHEPSTIQSSANSLNMSTYFASFDPSAQFQTNQLQVPVMQNKLNTIHDTREKVHRARINLVPNATGHLKSIVKRKRKRTIFRTDQVEVLENVFAEKPYVTKEDRKALVDRLQISDKSVKVWFQNRRLKNKRGDDQYISEDENRSSPNLELLDYVESKIQERTNEFGYVTLDDRIMNDLVKVIDDYLCKSNTDISTKSMKMEVEDIAMEQTKLKMESLPVYEPISPANTIEYSNEEHSWESQSPFGNEYLQRLIDIESIITN